MDWAMRLSDHIREEALSIVSRGLPLPHQLSSAPAFFVASEGDESILAFGAVTHEGSVYKIGPKRVPH
jgi:hypothetical protein